MLNTKRLKRLLLVLERVQADPKKRREFDLSVWGEKTPDCGTHMCACGWGAVDPVLNKQGFKLVRARYWDGTSIRTDSGGTLLKIKVGRHDEFTAVQRFFGLDSDTAERLFSPMEYVTNKSLKPVLTRLRKVIAGKSIVPRTPTGA